MPQTLAMGGEVVSGPIVVGVDGSDAALAAVDAAAHEARMRNAELHIVHAFVWPALHVPRGTSPLGPPAGAVRERVEEMLAAALARARAAAPGVQASHGVIAGEAVTALEAESRTAQLLVIGHRGPDGFVHVLLGSTAVHLAAHASCPVMVVRGRPEPAGPVLVAVDGSPQGQAAVAFAFTEAALRGADLVALHAWATWSDHDKPTPGRPLEIVDLIGDGRQVQAAEERLLADALSGHRERYPDLTVHARLVRGRTRPALIEATESAQLIVVGARGRGGFTGLLLGSVSQSLLHHAQCPVTVVRAGVA
jgi:nucleotide-binding universal stress UspA family protein